MDWHWQGLSVLAAAMLGFDLGESGCLYVFAWKDVATEAAETLELVLCLLLEPVAVVHYKAREIDTVFEDADVVMPPELLGPHRCHSGSDLVSAQ